MIKYAKIVIFVLTTGLCLPNVTACSDGYTSEDALNDQLLFQQLSPHLGLDQTGDPTVRFHNSSGTTEIYAIYGGTGCTGTTIHAFNENPMTNGSRSGYATIPAGTFYISYNVPSTANCRTGPATFEAGKSYTCVAGATTIECLED